MCILTVKRTELSLLNLVLVDYSKTNPSQPIPSDLTSPVQSNPIHQNQNYPSTEPIEPCRPHKTNPPPQHLPSHNHNTVPGSGLRTSANGRRKRARGSKAPHGGAPREGRHRTLKEHGPCCNRAGRSNGRGGTEGCLTLGAKGRLE